MATKKSASTSLLSSKPKFSKQFVMLLCAVLAVFGVYYVLTTFASTNPAGGGKGGGGTICTDKVVQSGTSGDCVKYIQRMLNSLYSYRHYSGGATISVDGSFGSKTKAQVQALQKYGNLTQDGIVGQHTWYLMCAQEKVVSQDRGTSDDGYKAGTLAPCANIYSGY